MRYLSLLKNEKNQLRIFGYAFCASLVIHAGVFLLLVKLNERWRWIPVNESVFEVSLVTQAGGAPKASGPGNEKPAAQHVAPRKKVVIKKSHTIKTICPKEPLKPSEIKLADLTDNHSEKEKAPAETGMTMISDTVPNTEKSGNGNSKSHENEESGSIGGNGANTGEGGGGGFGSRMTYLNMVRLKIENQKKYPSAAQERNIEGEVTVEFNIGLDGRISEPSVFKSSGYRLLDFAAIEAVRKASPFASPPRNFFSQSIHISLPIRFELVR